MKSIFTLCLIAFAALPSYARLGETMDQITARFGPSTGPGDHPPQFGETALKYLKNGVEVTVNFLDGKSQFEALRNPDRSPFTDKEIAAFLNAESQGQTWRKDNDQDPKTIMTWTRTDGSACVYLPAAGAISFISASYQAMLTKAASKPADKTTGF